MTELIVRDSDTLHYNTTAFSLVFTLSVTSCCVLWIVWNLSFIILNTYLIISPVYNQFSVVAIVTCPMWIPTSPSLASWLWSLLSSPHMDAFLTTLLASVSHPWLSLSVDTLPHFVLILTSCAGPLPGVDTLLLTLPVKIWIPWLLCFSPI